MRDLEAQTKLRSLHLLVNLVHDPALVLLARLQLILNILHHSLKLPDILLELILPLLLIFELG